MLFFYILIPDLITVFLQNCRVFGAVIWPCVPLVVRPNATGQGFGLLTSSQNLSTTITPLLAALLYSPNLRYDRILLAFVYMAVLGCVIAVCIIVVDEIYFHAKLRLRTVQDTLEVPVLILDESSSVSRPPLYRPSPLLTSTTGIAYYPKAKSATLTALISMEAQPLLPTAHSGNAANSWSRRQRSYSSTSTTTGICRAQENASQEFDRDQLRKTKTIRRSFKF